MPKIAPSPGLRIFLLVALYVMAAISGLLTVLGVVGVAAGTRDPGSLAFFGAFAVLFALAISAIVGVTTRATWARPVAIVAGVAVSLTCLGLVIGIPILIAAARAPILALKTSEAAMAEGPISNAVTRYFPNQLRTLFATNLLSYVLLLAFGIAGLAIISRVIERGLLRTIVYLVVLWIAQAFVAWVAASRPTALAVIVTPEVVRWRDQRLHDTVLDRREIASIQRRAVRVQIGGKVSGNWLVGIEGWARFRLSRSTPASELARALGVDYLEFPEELANPADLERVLPGSTDLARQKPLWKYVVPSAVGVAAVLLDQLT